MKRTCLYERHVRLGAEISPFAGFEMPIRYTDLIEEHIAVRQKVGLFDVSHMGEARVTGPDAEKWVNHIFTNDISTMQPHHILYGMMCYEDGGTVDDLLVYKMAEQDYFIVFNAGNIDKDVAWMRQNLDGYDVNLEHQSDYYGQLAIQGPEAEATVRTVLGLETEGLLFYTSKEIDRDDETIILSRTGYTGEDGFEVYGSHAYIQDAWDKLIAAGVAPCGLGCRDTLRFEAGLPLYGDELSEQISPIMAGLGIFVKLDKAEFIGKDALAKQKAEKPAKLLRGISFDGKLIPRHGYPIFKDGVQVGEVTTGYRGISVQGTFAMALLDSTVPMGDSVEVQVRKKTMPGTIVKKRFYNPNYKKA